MIRQIQHVCQLNLLHVVSPSIMAERITFTCKGCGFEVESWDDGNPYIQGPRGKRYYFYHPCEQDQIARIVEKILGHVPDEGLINKILRTQAGNAADYLCQDCLKYCKRDASKDKLRCTSCKSANIVRTRELSGHLCPSCRRDRFDRGQISGIS